MSLNGNVRACQRNYGPIRRIRFQRLRPAR